MTGLRGRFILAMALVSAVTLGVTALLLFSPLEHRLQDDALDGMINAVRADRLAFGRLDAATLVPGSPTLHRTIRSLHRGSGADVALIDSDGRLLYSTDPDDLGASKAALAALDDGQVQRGQTGSDAERVARVVVPLTLDGRRVAVELSRPLESVSSGVRVVRNAFLLAAGISLLVALLVGILLSWRLVRRLRSLRDTALRVAEIGPVAEMRGDDSPDEVGDLTRALVTMQDRLREQEQARRAFVATASHELRTPLTSLTILLDTLRQDLEQEPADVVRARDGAERAEAQAVRLSGLAGELLDLSRIDAGLPLRAEPVPLDEVVRSVAAEFEVRLVESGRRIDIAVDGDPWARADPGSVARIVRILLDNALRHAPDGPGVDVRVVRQGSEAVVSVRDHGDGVAEEDRERIFQRFSRGERTDVPGFGLGLAIGRELAQRMGGDLVLAPPGDGGAVFTLRLPSAPAG